MGKILVFIGVGLMALLYVFFFLKDSWAPAEFWMNILIAPSILVTLGGVLRMILKGD